MSGPKKSKIILNPSNKTVSPKKEEQSKQFLAGVKAIIVEHGLGKTRASVLSKQLEKYGGSVHKNLNSTTGYIIISKTFNLKRLHKILKIKELPDHAKVVDADWLSSCFMSGKLCSETSYIIKDQTEDKVETKIEEITSGDKSGVDQSVDLEERPPSPCAPAKAISSDSEVREREEKSKGIFPPINPSWWRIKKRKRDGDEEQGSSGSDSSFVESDGESTEDGQTKLKGDFPAKRIPSVSPEKPMGSWVCTKPSSSRGDNLNEHITEKLEVLLKAYTNTQDRWRALGYKKAIAAIKNYPKRIETLEEVNKLPFVGERLAKKIWEIIETGHLRRLDHLDPKMDAINLFADVWGAGPKTAEVWVAQGHRTLEDLKEKADLNFQQQIGLKYYHEFLERMPREEVEEIEKTVRAAANSLVPGLELVTCGSYRRGRQTCGDVDILISHPDGRSHKGILNLLLDKLHNDGFITDDLVTVDNEEQRKYLGVCKLSGESRKHRRIDFIVAPYNEWACALIHFTGSGHLNRSMRQLAKTKGMSLSEHALRTGVVRKGQEKIHQGTIVPTFTEEDVFRHLGLDYLEPHDRDW